MLFEATFLSGYVCGQIFENMFYFLDLLEQKLFFEKNHWFQLLSTKNDWSISLVLISITLRISQPFHHVCCWRINKLAPSMKTLLLLFAKSPNVRKNCFSVCFLSFFRFFCFCFFGLLRPLLQICWVWLTQTHQKVLTKSP